MKSLADVELRTPDGVPVRLGDVVVVVGLGIIGMFCQVLARRTAGTLVVVDPFEFRRAIAGLWSITESRSA